MHAGTPGDGEFRPATMNGSATEGMLIGEIIEKVRQVGMRRPPNERRPNLPRLPLRLGISDHDWWVRLLQGLALYCPVASGLVLHTKNERVCPHDQLVGPQQRGIHIRQITTQTPSLIEIQEGLLGSPTKFTTLRSVEPLRLRSQKRYLLQKHCFLPLSFLSASSQDQFR